MFRRPGDLDIETPIVNAAIKGTEFLVSVADDGESRVFVQSGQVAISGNGEGGNPTLGSVTLASGYALSARPGADLAAIPLKVATSRDELAWSMYFPPLLDGALTGPSQSASTLLAAGDVHGAEQTLASPDLQDDANALALRATIALVRGRKDEGMKYAESARRMAPHATTAAVALSYALQGTQRIEEALDTVLACEQDQTCTSAQPQFAARIVELLLANGKVSQASRRCGRDDKAPLATACGFVALALGHSSEAIARFELALPHDQTNPLVRLGLGLAKIQDGQDIAGRIELENAIAIDPLQSILRSYLGRAYLEEGTCRIFRLEHECAVFSNRSIELATEQLELARALDTQDPTPDLYAAAVANANNRPSEALDHIEASIKKNRNRAVYRSRLLLDRDLAARGVSLALAYDRLGFKHRGLQVAAASVNSDPSNYSAHRFLADSYQNSRRLGVATASEILQYQLLQPVNANPVRPQLSQTDLKLSDRIGPPNASLNEYHRAFQGDGAHIVGSYSIASDDTSSSEILASGAYKGFSASIGQFLASGDGYRENNDFDISVKEAFFQHEINNEVSALVDLQDRSSVEGDRFTPFNSEGAYEDIRIRISRSAARFGLRYQPTPDLTMVATHLGASRRETQKLQPVPGRYFDIGADLVAHISDISTIYTPTDDSSLILGGSFGSILRKRIDRKVGGNSHVHDQQASIYGYFNQKTLWGVVGTVGAALESVRDNGFDQQKLFPKLGIVIPVSTIGALRGAYTASLKRNIVAAPTLEPTQVAGFVQMMDDRNSFLGRQIAVGFDSGEFMRSSAGFNIVRRALTHARGDNDERFGGEKYEEFSYKGYLYTRPVSQLSLAVAPELDILNLRKGGVGDNKFRTWIVPAGVRAYFAAGGTTRFRPLDFEIGLTGTHVTQLIGEQVTNFHVLDASLSYRFSQRLGAITASVRNLLASRFRYEEYAFQTAEFIAPRFEPGRSVGLQVVLNWDL